jgi:hypothetical protein
MWGFVFVSCSSRWAKLLALLLCLISLSGWGYVPDLLICTRLALERITQVFCFLPKWPALTTLKFSKGY